ncbi:MAG: hypothetical protein Q4C50_10265, partial [Eubacteriales bacterium]|nr:hypothetical protein [Eubacteriales bacterium]
MRDFVFAAGADFIDLERILSDGKLHVYYNRVLPKGCVPGKARIGFEKSSECYSVMIDKGIKSNASGTALDCLLEKGEIRFLCMDDMREFFYSLRTLFPEADAPDNNERHDGTEKAGSLPV